MREYIFKYCFDINVGYPIIREHLSILDLLDLHPRISMTKFCEEIFCFHVENTAYFCHPLYLGFDRDEIGVGLIFSFCSSISQLLLKSPNLADFQ